MNGSVTDFLSTAFMKFPVFNVPDICVTVGVACAIIGYWIWDSRQERKADSRDSDARHA